MLAKLALLALLALGAIATDPAAADDPSAEDADADMGKAGAAPSSGSGSDAAQSGWGGGGGPTGGWRPYFEIHPGWNKGKCLDVRGANYANGTPVQIYDCNGTGAQKWVYDQDQGHLRVYGTGYCLDAGSYPHSGVGMKIWQCYDNLPAQNWRHTMRRHIALRSTDQCLDVPNGNLWNGNQVQTWKCYGNNPNQVWTF